jgi:hypothetical protein
MHYHYDSLNVYPESTLTSPPIFKLTLYVREIHIETCMISDTYCNYVAVAQLVEALCYKTVGRGFDSRWSHRNFSVT